MASKCRKFEPNIFNKSKCQACFGAKDAHSAEALHNNKVGFSYFFQIYNALCDTGVYMHACTIAVLTPDICKICGVYLLSSAVCLINGYS